MSFDNQSIRDNINNSETELPLKEQVQKQLEISKAILESAKDVNGGSNEIYKKIQTEQKELQQAITIALENDNIITQSELNTLKLELSDIQRLSIQNELDGHESYKTTIKYDDILWKKTSTINENFSYLNINIGEIISSGQAINTLNHLNKEYSDYSNSLLYTLTDKNTLSDLKDKYDVEQFQEKLIAGIIWNDKVHDGNRVKCYSEDKWYYLEQWETIENNLRNFNPENFNPVTLKNYINFIVDKFHKNSSKIEEYLNNTFTNKKSKFLIEIWYNNDLIENIEDQAEELAEIKEEAEKYYKEAESMEFDDDEEFESKELEKLYKSAYKEEVLKQKTQFNKKFIDFTEWNITIEELRSEMDDIRLLSSVTNLIQAWIEWVNYYVQAENNNNIWELKKILNKMNIIYISAKVHNISLTWEFKDTRDTLSRKIIELEKKDNPNLKSDENPAIWHISYNPKEISNQIMNNQYENIDKYELFFYIKNEHWNFSEKTVQQLLTKYPRNFVMYISWKFLEDGWILSTLVDKKKEFLTELKSINKVLNLSTVNDLNLATDEFSDKLTKKNSDEWSNTSIELDQAKDWLNDQKIRKKFLDTIMSDPDNLNKYLQELKEYAIELEFKNTRPELIKEILLNEPNLNKEEIEKRLDLYKKDVLDGIKNWLKWDQLAKYLIEKGHAWSITKKILSVASNGLKKTNNLIQEVVEKVKITDKESDNISEEKKESIISKLEDEIINNEIFVDREEKINILNDQDFETLRDKLSQWETFDEIDEYFSENNKEYKELLERQSIKNDIIENDFREIESPIYQDYQIDNNWEWSFLISEKNKEKIEITEKEAELVENNPEALKNLIDTKEKLDILWLDFIWTYRSDYIETMKSTPWFMDSKMNVWDDFINPVEFNNLLRFTLSLLWEIPTDSYSWNISKIVKISSVSETDNKTDFVTWYGKIWTQLHEMWYIWESSIDTNNITNMQNYKQTIIDYKQKKEA